jgi:hypothetical protein
LPGKAGWASFYSATLVSRRRAAGVVVVGVVLLVAVIAVEPGFAGVLIVVGIVALIV